MVGSGGVVHGGSVGRGERTAAVAATATLPDRFLARGGSARRGGARAGDGFHRGGREWRHGAAAGTAGSGAPLGFLRGRKGRESRGEGGESRASWGVLLVDEGGRGGRHGAAQPRRHGAVVSPLSPTVKMPLLRITPGSFLLFCFLFLLIETSSLFYLIGASTHFYTMCKNSYRLLLNSRLSKKLVR